MVLVGFFANIFTQIIAFCSCLNNLTNLTIQTLLTNILATGTFTEQELGEINFREISTPILEKVIQYFYYNLRYSNSTVEIPEFEVQPEIALELLMAANFLGTL